MKLRNLRLGFAVFMCGALLMALEIMGSRLLTPSYGDTVYVWGSVIGVFLLSLSVGYYLGGRIADRRPSVYILSLIVLLVGISIPAIPFIYRPIVSLFNVLPRFLAPLAAVTAIFLVPSVLLGTVSPFVIKLEAKDPKDLHKIGKLSGNLYALSTLGSVIGTFAATFVLILFFPVKAIFLLLSGISFIVAAVLSERNIPFAAVGIVALVLLSSIIYAPVGGLTTTLNTTQGELNTTQSHVNTTSAYANATNVSGVSSLPRGPIDVEVESLYGLVSVSDRGTIRSLYINGGAMSEINLKNESRTVAGWKYFDCMELPFLLEPKTKDVLAMGLGGGVYQKRLHDKYNASVDTVEINEKVVEMAQKYFGVQPSNTFRIYVDDARAFLDHTDKKYDFITIDTFHHDPEQGYKIPFHLSTQEFFIHVKEHLNPGGIVAMNFASDAGSTFFRSEYKTLGSVFNSTYAFSCDTMIIVATDNSYNIPELKKTMPDPNRLLFRYRNISLSGKGNVMILTDDFAPTNSFSELMVGEIYPNVTEVFEADATDQTDNVSHENRLFDNATIQGNEQPDGTALASYVLFITIATVGVVTLAKGEVKKQTS
jgi:predicted membrane-bound spermidine synthase